MKTTLLYSLSYPIGSNTKFWYFESPSSDTNGIKILKLIQKYDIFIDTDIPITTKERILMDLKLLKKLGSDNKLALQYKVLYHFHRIKMPIVLGELLAGIVVGPFALGSFPFFDGKPLVVLDETMRHIGQISAIVILFIAGLEITPKEFLKGGSASFTVGSIGVIVPFFIGYFVFVAFGLKAIESLLVATALTATSIAISIQVLTELGKMQSKEARLILGAAIVDDILAIAALSVVITMVQTGNVAPDIISITLLILKILGLFAALLIGAVLIVPRILHVEKLWRSKGSIEGITTATFFGAAGMAAFMNLSPIVGAFAVGMAVSSTKIIKRVEEYVEKLQIIFAPLFFAIIGAQVDLRGVNFNVLLLSGVIVSIAIVTKLIGCGLPSMIFLRNSTKSMRVGIGMVSRGEVGLIVAGVGVTSGALSADIYTAVMCVLRYVKNTCTKPLKTDSSTTIKYC